MQVTFAETVSFDRQGTKFEKTPVKEDMARIGPSLTPGSESTAKTPAANEWQRIKRENFKENQEFNATDEQHLLGDKKNLPLNEDGSLSVFWFDAHEESNTTGEIYLFGKIRLRTGKLASCCVTVRGMHREMYVLPRKGGDGEEQEPKEQRMFAIH